jgi:hypothetical protein
MFVNVYGTQVEVSVSDGGMFFDTATKQHSAKTLKGLEKKLKEAKPQNTQGIPVEYHNSNRQGVVLSRANSKSHYRRQYFRVRWSDNSITEEHGGYLRKPMPTEDRIKESELKSKVAAAQDIVYKEQEKVTAEQKVLNTFHAKYRIQSELEIAFPIKYA